MAPTEALYNDRGADYYSRQRPDLAEWSAVRQFEALGYALTLERAG